MNLTIKHSFGTPLKAAGFVCKGDSWYLDCKQTVLVCNLQKSEYSEKYYVNLAVWLKGIEKEEVPFPREHKCHVRLRLRALVDEDSLRVFDVEGSPMPDDARHAGIVQLMNEHAIPFLQSCTTTVAILGLLHEGKLRQAFVHKRVKELV